MIVPLLAGCAKPLDGMDLANSLPSEGSDFSNMEFTPNDSFTWTRNRVNHFGVIRNLQALMQDIDFMRDPLIEVKSSC